MDVAAAVSSSVGTRVGGGGGGGCFSSSGGGEARGEMSLEVGGLRGKRLAEEEVRSSRVASRKAEGEEDGRSHPESSSAGESMRVRLERVVAMTEDEGGSSEDGEVKLKSARSRSSTPRV